MWLNRKVVADRSHGNLKTRTMQYNAREWRMAKFENKAFVDMPDGIISILALELLHSRYLPLPSIPMRAPL